MTTNMLVATIGWTLLVFGYTRRTNRTQHLWLVIPGILIDIGLVIYLQIAREAVQTALEFSLSIYEQLHIAFSTLALVMYLPVCILGFLVMKGDQNKRALHKKIAITALLFRTAGFVFMFSMFK